MAFINESMRGAANASGWRLFDESSPPPPAVGNGTEHHQHYYEGESARRVARPLHLDIVVKPFPPNDACAITHGLARSTHCKPGPEAETLYEILRYTGWRHTVHSGAGASYGSFNASESDGILSNITLGRYDTMVEWWTANEYRRRFADFSIPFERQAGVFLVKRPVPGLLDVALKPVSMYSVGLWLTMIATLGTLVLVMGVGRAFLSKTGRRAWAVGVWDNLSFIFNDEPAEGHTRVNPSCSANILVALLSALLLLVKSLYQNLILIVLLFPVSMQPFENVDQLVAAIAEGRIHLAVDDPSFYLAERIEHSAYPTFAQLRRATRHNKIRFVTGAQHVMGNVTGANVVYFCHTEQICAHLQAGDPLCQTQTVSAGGELPHMQMQLVVPKGWPHLDTMNEALRASMETISAVRQRYNVVPDSCGKVLDANKQQREALQLLNMAPIFILYIFGMTLALLSFLCETCVKKRQRQRNNTEDGKF